MNIAILDDYQDVVKNLSCFSLLKDHEVSIFTDTPVSIDKLIQRLYDKDAIVLIRERTQITDQLISHLPKLKLISQTGKISHHIDLATCLTHNVAIAEGIGSPVAPAELCWSLVLAASRHLVPYASNLKTGLWQNSGELGLGRTLQGLTFGIWGYGRIGKRIANYANAFGMKVLIWGSVSSRAQAVEDGFNAAMSKQDFFSQSDIISLHLRLNDATRGCVNFEDLQQMKNDALLVNTSRAELIEKSALPRSLLTGKPGFAALDVFDSEPAGIETEPLLNMPNVLCTPHLGYVEKNSYELYFKSAFENVIDFFNGKPQNIVNITRT
ncbi:MAG: D-2-hydroxyacid dehydrogenase family protein [Formivibrio sp.]|nr:D-2-hydroxyacid dehydrogenase family protein [Formivibrio sp.]